MKTRSNRRRAFDWARLFLLPLATLLTGSALGQSNASLYTFNPNGTLAAAVSSNSAPTVIAPPQSQLLQPNGPLSLSVVANGQAPLSYQWFLNGTAVIGATNDTFFLATAPTNYLGSYTVVLSNSSGSVTSAPAPVWLDANGNGIPDWWEMYYFHNLNQLAGGDYDNDGVSNLDEYREGTNPTNAASFNPRLVLTSAHGTVSVTPLQPYYSKGQYITLTATADPGHEFTGWSGSVIGAKPLITVLMDTNKFITATFGFPLGIALDNTNLLWSTGGDASWFGQAETSFDGGAAAQSGPIVSAWNGSTFVGEQTWLQTMADLSQPTLLSFWWSVSSRPPAGLSFALDGALVASISGEMVEWQNVQTNLAPGRHTLTWTYSKGPVDIPTGVPFADSGWVDQVSLATQSRPPTLGIRLTTSNTVAVFWPSPSSGWTLQQNTNGLSSGNWSNISSGIQDDGTTRTLVINPTGANGFYRLTSP